MATKPDEWMPLHVRRYLGDTTRLTRDQHGAYLLLLMTYWIDGGALPDDDGQLAAICKATAAEWKRIRPILAPYFQITDGRWVQKRAEKELVKARELVEAKSKAGKEGAKKRWQIGGTAIGTGNGTVMADASQNHKQTDAPLPQPIPKEEQKVISSFVVGLGRAGKGGVTVEDPNDRLAIFQRKIAEALGKNGWTIVAAAADPSNPNYNQALQACKDAAQRLGKGWPRLWPTPQQNRAAGNAAESVKTTISGNGTVPGQQN